MAAKQELLDAIKEANTVEKQYTDGKIDRDERDEQIGAIVEDKIKPVLENDLALADKDAFAANKSPRVGNVLMEAAAINITSQKKYDLLNKNTLDSKDIKKQLALKNQRRDEFVDLATDVLPHLIGSRSFLHTDQGSLKGASTLFQHIADGGDKKVDTDTIKGLIETVDADKNNLMHAAPDFGKLSHAVGNEYKHMLLPLAKEKNGNGQYPFEVMKPADIAQVASPAAAQKVDIPYNTKDANGLTMLGRIDPANERVADGDKDAQRQQALERAKVLLEKGANPYATTSDGRNQLETMTEKLTAGLDANKPKEKKIIDEIKKTLDKAVEAIPKERGFQKDGTETKPNPNRPKLMSDIVDPGQFGKYAAVDTKGPTGRQPAAQQPTDLGKA